MKQAPAETPLFTKTHDFLTWLMTAVNHFPKLHRHTVTKRLLDAALDFLECLLEANVYRGEKRLLKLIEADIYLNKVRNYLRLAHRWKWINMRRYEHPSRLVAELGHLFIRHFPLLSA